MSDTRRIGAEILLTLLNLACALLLCGGLIALIGEDPLAALGEMVVGAFGSPEAIGFTLYYATDFIFAGLAVGVALHAGLFNIGVEGQAMLGGLGAGLAALATGDGSPWIALPVSILAAGLLGAAWAFLPGWLQARRGSHVVVTTIMFNFIATALLTWLLVDVLIAPGQQAPETRRFGPGATLASLQDLAGGFGLELPATPLNLAFLLALLAAGLFALMVGRTRWGYALRTVGHSPRAAAYAGISIALTTVLAMMVSGGLSGMVAVNELLGAQHRLLLGFTGGAGFVGIAVALMGRNSATGIVLAAVLFGALYQGGSELAFEMPAITRDMIVVVQGLVVLFCGGLENLLRRPVARFMLALPGRGPADA